MSRSEVSFAFALWLDCSDETKAKEGLGSGGFPGRALGGDAARGAPEPWWRVERSGRRRGYGIHNGGCGVLEGGLM